jgi:hypothetical protein
VDTFTKNLKLGTLSLQLLCAAVPFLFVIGCASEADNPAKTAPTKADIQARDDFARNLPKPSEH